MENSIFAIDFWWKITQFFVKRNINSLEFFLILSSKTVKTEAIHMLKICIVNFELLFNNNFDWHWNVTFIAFTGGGVAHCLFMNSLCKKYQLDLKSNEKLSSDLFNDIHCSAFLLNLRIATQIWFILFNVYCTLLVAHVYSVSFLFFCSHSVKIVVFPLIQLESVKWKEFPLCHRPSCMR